MNKKASTQLPLLIHNCTQKIATLEQHLAEASPAQQQEYEQLLHLVQQIQHRPSADALIDPDLMQAAEEFWAAVYCTKALLMDEELL